MKKNISYEKNILFKTSIGEICSISLEHDFTVDDGFLRGDFIISGEYKANELSINKDAFNYRLPLEYELEDNVDISTLSYDVENFEYYVSGDELDIYIDFGIRYDEKPVEPIIPDVIEDEEITVSEDIDKKMEDIREIEIEEPTEEEEEVELPRFKDDRNETVEELNEEDKNIVLDNAINDETYITYHVHIVREGESLESIASKYNVSVDTIKKYNDFEMLELKSKLIIPEEIDE